MSNIISRLTRLLTALFTSDATSIEPDSMSLHDWADLPAHHPSA
jgi:hypothetical protein